MNWGYLGWEVVEWSLVKGWFWEVGLSWFCGCGFKGGTFAVGFGDRL